VKQTCVTKLIHTYWTLYIVFCWLNKTGKLRIYEYCGAFA